jgi:hypothetical protein
MDSLCTHLNSVWYFGIARLHLFSPMLWQICTN